MAQETDVKAKTPDAKIFIPTFTTRNFNQLTSTEMKKVISTPDAPAAIGPYSQAIEANNMLFVSGQLPIDPATGAFASDEIKAAGLGMGDIVKTTVFLADMSLFGSMNEVYAQYFQGDFPARCAFAVKQLPKDALVEIECIAAR